MTGIVWQNPPPTGAGRPHSERWAAIALELQAHPGQWGLVAEAVNYGHIASIKRAVRRLGGACEVTSRNGRMVNDKRVADLYARWVEDT